MNIVFLGFDFVALKFFIAAAKKGGFHLADGEAVSKGCAFVVALLEALAEGGHGDECKGFGEWIFLHLTVECEEVVEDAIARPFELFDLSLKRLYFGLLGVGSLDQITKKKRHVFKQFFLLGKQFFVSFGGRKDLEMERFGASAFGAADGVVVKDFELVGDAISRCKGHRCEIPDQFTCFLFGRIAPFLEGKVLFFFEAFARKILIDDRYLGQPEIIFRFKDKANFFAFSDLGVFFGREQGEFGVFVVDSAESVKGAKAQLATGIEVFDAVFAVVKEGEFGGEGAFVGSDFHGDALFAFADQVEFGFFGVVEGASVEADSRTFERSKGAIAIGDGLGWKARVSGVFVADFEIAEQEFSTDIHRNASGAVLLGKEHAAKQIRRKRSFEGKYSKNQGRKSEKGVGLGFKCFAWDELTGVEVAEILVDLLDAGFGESGREVFGVFGLMERPSQFEGSQKTLCFGGPLCEGFGEGFIVELFGIAPSEEDRGCKGDQRGRDPDRFQSEGWRGQPKPQAEKQKKCADADSKECEAAHDAKGPATAAHTAQKAFKDLFFGGERCRSHLSLVSPMGR